jgi:hypothetical protein
MTGNSFWFGAYACDLMPRGRAVVRAIASLGQASLMAYVQEVLIYFLPRQFGFVAWGIWFLAGLPDPGDRHCRRRGPALESAQSEPAD